MAIEIGKVYHVKKFEELPEEFPTCVLEHYTYKHYLCDTVVKVSEVDIFEDPDWGTHCKCASCDPKKDWGYPFYINEQLLEEIPDEKTVSFDEWEGDEYEEA